MECWFWNIDAKSQQFFADELKKGRLHQGWGYDPKLDLRRIKLKLQQPEELDEEERAAWDRCHTMLEYIRAGDLVAVKNVPNREVFSIVQVNGPYDYRVDPKLHDFGHCLAVTEQRVFNKYSSVVPAPFVNALNRAQSPIVITYKHKDAVIRLHQSKFDEEAAKPEQFKEKLRKWRVGLVPELKKILRSDIRHRPAERLVLNLLKRDGLDVAWTAGPSEKGADVIGTVGLAYSLSARIAVQIKMHWDVDDDLTGIDQLERAFKEHSVEAGLLVTFADKLGPKLSEKVEKLKQKYKVDVLYGEELYLLLLELIADSNYESI